MLTIKAFSRASLNMIMSIAFLSFVATGVAEDTLKTVNLSPSNAVEDVDLPSNAVEDVDLLTRAIWVAQSYVYPKHLDPTISLYGYRGTDINSNCSLFANNNSEVGTFAFVWDKDKAVSKTRKLTNHAGSNFMNPTESYTVKDICSLLERRKNDLIKQDEKLTEENSSLFVITQKPIPNVWPTHRYVVEKKRKTGQGH